MQEKIVILDFGSQYTQLIARRVRELNVYCEIHPFNKIPELDASVRGVILSGSPFSVRDENAPKPDLTAIKGRLPLLGVCYGAQYLAHFYGGEVQSAPSREYGRAMLTVVEPSDPLMQGVPSPTQVWMSHGDTITSVPDTYRVIASTEDVRYAAFRIEGERSWGIQFHPEVYHSTDGITLLRNFVVGIAAASRTGRRRVSSKRPSGSCVRSWVTTVSCSVFPVASIRRWLPCCCIVRSVRTFTVSSWIQGFCARTSSTACSNRTRGWV